MHINIDNILRAAKLMAKLPILAYSNLQVKSELYIIVINTEDENNLVHSIFPYPECLIPYLLHKRYLVHIFCRGRHFDIIFVPASL